MALGRGGRARVGMACLGGCGVVFGGGGCGSGPVGGAWQVDGARRHPCQGPIFSGMHYFFLALSIIYLKISRKIGFLRLLGSF